MISTSSLIAQYVVEEAVHVAEHAQDCLAKAQASSTFPDSGMFYAPDFIDIAKKTDQVCFERFRDEGSFVHEHAEKFDNIKNEKRITGLSKDLVIKPGILPTEALESLETSLTIIECQKSAHLVFYRALRRLLGDEKFNILFAADSKTPLRLGTYSEDPNSLFLLTRSAKTQKKGTLVYVPNLDVYTTRHPFGVWDGHNLFVIGPNLYTAFGLPPKGVTLNELNKMFFNGFNATPCDYHDFIPQSKISEFEEKDAKRLQASKMYKDYKLFATSTQRIDPDNKRCLDTKRVCQLIHAPTRVARALMDHWAKQELK